MRNSYVRGSAVKPTLTVFFLKQHSSKTSCADHPKCVRGGCAMFIQGFQSLSIGSIVLRHKSPFFNERHMEIATLSNLLGLAWRSFFFFFFLVSNGRVGK